jgi:hypothetical protein
MSSKKTLYDVFTGKGVLPTHWSASGVRTEYDPETKDLVFELPPGWTDGMSDSEAITRRELWAKVDDPTYKVDYLLKVQKKSDTEEPSVADTKLVVAEHDDGTIEFRTNIDFEGVRKIERGAELSVSLCARAKIFKGEPVRIPLLKGIAKVPEKTLWLSENTPGFFFVVDGGMAVSFHTLPEAMDREDGWEKIPQTNEDTGDEEESSSTVRVTHVSFCGKTKHMDEW